MSLAEITPIRAAGPLAPATSRTESAVFSWKAGIATLVLLIWLVPIKRYTLPVSLPFRLEPYRLWILVLLVALVLAVLAGRVRIGAGGHAKPVLLLAVAALGAQLANMAQINAAGLQTQSLKSLSFFLSFLIAFVLISSTIRYRDEIDAIIRIVVIGGTIVAIAALIESKTNHNYFDDLHRWFPILRDTGGDKYNYRGGRLRVRASAQHPIALAAVLLITVPFAIYVSRRALSAARSRLWLVAALLLTAGAIATVSRTGVMMLAAMTVVALIFRRREVLRRWPAIIVLIGLSHVMAPGAVSHLYSAFNPKQGLINQQSIRSGQRGSGRIADIPPGIRRWAAAPIFGRGLGTDATTADPVAVQAAGAGGVRVIYDDQYLSTLISLGGLGFVGLMWFVWGGVRKFGRAARRAGPSSDLLVACTASTAAFGVGMLTYDALSFVQVSLLFFVICGLGLRARALAARE